MTIYRQLLQTSKALSDVQFRGEDHFIKFPVPENVLDSLKDKGQQSAHRDSGFNPIVLSYLADHPLSTQPLDIVEQYLACR